MRRQGLGPRAEGIENSMLKFNKLAAFGAIAATLVLAGCRQDMQDQPKFFPQRGTDFYADGRSVRPQVENTVARGQLREDSYFSTGLVNGKEGDGLPFPATMAVLERGQERYNVYCTPCHSRVGNGIGMIVQRGYMKAGSFHSARLEAAPLGHFFQVISNGYGAMPDYASQITPEDRWAIVAYIKALQLSQKATQADVPAGQEVQPLGTIAEKQGLPASFAEEWELPPTAVTGTTDGGLYVLPSTGATGTTNGATTPAHAGSTTPSGTSGQTVPKQ
jgi:mono/diheme cytochrome c family protein